VIIDGFEYPISVSRWATDSDPSSEWVKIRCIQTIHVDAQPGNVLYGGMQMTKPVKAKRRLAACGFMNVRVRLIHTADRTPPHPSDENKPTQDVSDAFYHRQFIFSE